MAIIQENEIQIKVMLETAKQMLVAARTAPKGKGVNNIDIKLVTGKDIEELANKMKEIGNRTSVHIFERDAENILQAPVVFIIACRINPLGIQECGLCGFKNCDEKRKYPNVPCTFNTTDLGIALGSAVATAKDLNADNRIMYTVGQAVLEMGIFEEEYKIAYGVPISATSKNPFFDRKPKK